MTNYERSAACGKFKCYFESCDGSFSDVDTLNEHLRGVHGLSILKNAGKRSKMDLMLLEQIKQQSKEQVVELSQEASQAATSEHQHEMQQMQSDTAHLAESSVQYGSPFNHPALS